MATFTERLKELREEKKLKQEELGEIIGVSKDTIYRWENGKQQPKENHIILLAQFFQVDFLYLIGAIDERNMAVIDDADDEEAERKAEERLLSIYRSLSPDLKKMIQLIVGCAHLVEQERKKVKR